MANIADQLNHAQKAELVTHFEQKNMVFIRDCNLMRDHIGELKDQISTVQAQVAEAMEEHKRFQTPGSRMRGLGTANAVQELQRHAARETSRLEQELAMKKKRRDELIGATNKLKRFVDKLRTDKMAMDAVFQKMSAKLDGSQRELAELIDTSNTILKEKEEIEQLQADLAGEEQLTAEDHVGHLGEIQDEIDQTYSNLSVGKKKKPGNRSDSSWLEGGDDTRREEINARMADIKEQIRLANLQDDLAMESLVSYQRAFGALKQITGIENTKDMVETFLTAEEENFGLFRSVQELNKEIKGVNSQTDVIKADRAEYETMMSSHEQDKKSVIKQKQSEIDAINRERELFEGKAVVISRAISKLGDTIREMFFSLGCEDIAVEAEESEIIARMGRRPSQSSISSQSKALIDMYRARSPKSRPTAEPELRSWPPAVLDDRPVHSHDFVPAEEASKSPEAQSEGEGKSTDGEDRGPTTFLTGVDAAGDESGADEELAKTVDADAESKAEDDVAGGNSIVRSELQRTSSSLNIGFESGIRSPDDDVRLWRRIEDQVQHHDDAPLRRSALFGIKSLLADGVTEANVTRYLAIIEKKANEICEEFQDEFGQELRDDKGRRRSLVGPSTQPGGANVDVDPPILFASPSHSENQSLRSPAARPVRQERSLRDDSYTTFERSVEDEGSQASGMGPHSPIHTSSNFDDDTGFDDAHLMPVHDSARRFDTDSGRRVGASSSQSMRPGGQLKKSKAKSVAKLPQVVSRDQLLSEISQEFQHGALNLNTYVGGAGRTSGRKGKTGKSSEARRAAKMAARLRDERQRSMLSPGGGTVPLGANKLAVSMPTLPMVSGGGGQDSKRDSKRDSRRADEVDSRLSMHGAVGGVPAERRSARGHRKSGPLSRAGEALTGGDGARQGW